MNNDIDMSRLTEEELIILEDGTDKEVARAISEILLRLMRRDVKANLT